MATGKVISMIKKKVEHKESKGYKMVQLDDDAYWILRNRKIEGGLSSTSAAVRDLKTRGLSVDINDKIYDAWTDLTSLMKIYCGDQIAGLIDFERTIMMMVKDDPEKITFMIGQLEGSMQSFRERWPVSLEANPRKSRSEPYVIEPTMTSEELRQK